MKKLALLVGGEYRTFSQKFPTWKFLDQFDYDIFMSTWNSSTLNGDRNGIDDIDPKKSITESYILSTVGKTPKYLNLEQEIDFEHRGNKQIYHWQKILIKLINLQHEYDCAIITRPDIEIPDIDSFNRRINSIDLSKIYGASPINVTGPPLPFVVTVNDIFFMSTPKKLIDTLLPVPYMKIKSHTEIMAGRGDNFHTHLAHYFVLNNIYVYQMPGGIFVPKT